MGVGAIRAIGRAIGVSSCFCFVAEAAKQELTPMADVAEAAKQELTPMAAPMAAAVYRACSAAGQRERTWTWPRHESARGDGRRG
jgi:hypothetical protein